MKARKLKIRPSKLFPLYAELIADGSSGRGTVVRFESAKVGEVVKWSNKWSNNGYPVGFKTTNWISCLDKGWWKIVEKPT